MFGPPGFLDTNMLVSATRTPRFGGRIPNTKTQREWFHVAVEYRLFSGKWTKSSLKTPKSDVYWIMFVQKWQFWWSASIIFDNKNESLINI